MKEQSTETGTESRPGWDGLEAFARQGVQELLQRVLEEEVAALLGRRRYGRRRRGRLSQRVREAPPAEPQRGDDHAAPPAGPRAD